MTKRKFVVAQTMRTEAVVLAMKVVLRLSVMMALVASYLRGNGFDCA
jgi:hypothetical protein